LAGKNAQRKRLQKEKADALKKGVEVAALKELSDVMHFEGMKLEDYIGDMYDAYLMDHPEKEESFDDAVADMDIASLSRGGAFKSEETGLESRGGGLSQADQMHIMKYMQLKYTVLFLQKQKFVGRYCFYGCWCLPAGAGQQLMGYGVPVDNIDRSCREYTTCYNCLYNQEINGERCDEMAAIQKRYAITGNQDPATGKITLFCQDPQGSCARSRCECDKALSEKLHNYEDQWNQANHHKWANPPFNRELSCSPTNSAIASQQLHLAAVAAQTATLEAASFDPNKDQAGKTAFAPAKPEKDHVKKLANIISEISEDQKEAGADGDVILNIHKGSGGGKTKITQIVQSAPIYGPIAGCCGRAPNVHYYREGQRCCLDGEIVDLNAPCTMDFS